MEPTRPNAWLEAQHRQIDPCESTGHGIELRGEFVPVLVHPGMVALQVLDGVARLLVGIGEQFGKQMPLFV